MRREYFDPHLVVDEDIKKRLMVGGMDELLATHFAHLFIRDPIVVFAEDMTSLDREKANHFENLQSTNWQHMRFKPPPSGDNDTGWRVEFRSMEIQLTDFENAAFAIFIVLVTRAILSFDLNFYVPIPLVARNMETAHVRDGVLTQKFWFRKNPFPPARTTHKSPHSAGTSGTSTPLPPSSSRPATPAVGPVEDEYELMTIAEIVNGQAGSNSSSTAAAEDRFGGGSDGRFPGLVPLVESYLNSVNVDVETRCELARYLALIRRRADGSVWTAARWMRRFVREHAEYDRDSQVGEGIQFDLVKAARRIAECEGRDGLGREMLGGR